MAEIDLSEILKRATENCVRDGFRGEASEPTLLSRALGYGNPKTKVLDPSSEARRLHLRPEPFA
jgi:hypothetical protein